MKNDVFIVMKNVMFNFPTKTCFFFLEPLNNTLITLVSKIFLKNQNNLIQSLDGAS